jgi:hypothetical protein
MDDVVLTLNVDWAVDFEINHEVNFRIDQRIYGYMPVCFQKIIG